MTAQFDLRSFRQEIDRNYVGFDINGPKVKPVHIINGILRVICGKTFNTTEIKKLSYVESKKGKPGQSTESVMQELHDRDQLDKEIDGDTFESFRKVLQSLLDADGAVFGGTSKDDHMISYTLSSKYFLTKPAMYEDAGEFIGGILREYTPDLADFIENLVDDYKDPISMVFLPVLSEEYNEFDNEYRHHKVGAFSIEKEETKNYIHSLQDSASCLLKNLKHQSNRFSQLRIFNLFCMYQLFRYMSSLEFFYLQGKTCPALIDFSGKSNGSIPDASSMTYSQTHKSLSRFYAWGYANILRDKGYSLDDLKSIETPAKVTSNTDAEEIQSLWNMAKVEAEGCDCDEDAYEAYGMAIYNMLARDSQFHPANYLRAVGILSGVLYPPNSSHNRFVFSQDIVEMLMMCTVEPAETITKSEVRKRLIERSGVIIGGSAIESDYMSDCGLSIQADPNSLEHNFSCFVDTLESLGFAEIMADGILQIQMGGIS